MNAGDRNRAASLLMKMYSHTAFTENDVTFIIEQAVKALMQDSMLVETSAPIWICGDTHGQYNDVLRLFDRGGWPPKSRYLFLGDYVDRGAHSTEVICMMFLFKSLYPSDFYILRGNHECMPINHVYGFFAEVSNRFSVALYVRFQEAFNCLPVAGLVSSRILCMHGGLSPELKDWNQIRSVQRPLQIPNDGLLCDLLWADPDTYIKGWMPSSRGAGFTFGADVVTKFCQSMDIDLIARAHQVVNNGYEFFADKKLVTIFSAPNYCGEFCNSAGMLHVGADSQVKVVQLKPRNP
ncbi:hypothetical protein M514_05744, partial [Trichuris suis]